MGPVAHTPQTGDARSWPETGNLSQVAWNETTARLLIVVRGEEPRAVQQKDCDFELLR